MIRLNDFLDRLSLIKVLSFFLLIILILTLIPMVIKIHLGNLFFKFVLYGIMLLFFAYELNKIDFDGISFKSALRKEYDSIFNVADISHVSFIVIANMLFVSAIYFILKYLSHLSIIGFDSPLFGDFTTVSISILALYFLTVVLLSPIIEELLFRGLLLRRFNKELNVTLAILISSILFGLCHNFGGILGAILFGICVAILYIKSKNILVPIFVHFLNNLVSFLFALSGIEYLIQSNLLAIILIILLAIASNFVLFKAIFSEWPKDME
ncbi:MAG: CPBP family intramembrane metalloprotease [Methanobrevibacter olleyae]|uniref:CPBP family intramembrane metalloprotease n=1 Tax=Methanobrevibacter olleyae TaxID=294671 RepID=A0A8T3VUC5_METOL|nr:CPBP family intramembrane metalloprotease [Methanobrevibacter olleyae]